jgi:glycosyltransferase 2 family protein
MAEIKPQELTKYLRPGRLLAPILIGLGVASFMLYRNFDQEAFAKIEFSWYAAFWLFLAFMMVVIRDAAYMVRIKVLTEGELNWRQCFDVIMLWEFSSALAPAILGGGFAFAIIIINREKINLGRSISVVMFTSFLDGMFFALIAPLVYFGFGKDMLFSSLDPGTLQQLSHGGKLNVTFWVIYFVVLAYKLFVAYALFINARGVKSLLLKIFSIKVLRRWKFSALQTGTEMVIASDELKGKKLDYWIYSFVATCISWSARFIIINCIIKAFSSIGFDHLLLYARQVVIGILMIGSPTPGGSGVAELMFSNFLGEFIDNKSLTSALALLWRLISYYPYIFLGAIILPRWLSRVMANGEMKIKV